MHCSSTVPPWAAVSATIPAPAWAPLHRLQIFVGCCFCVGSPWAAVSFSMYPSAAVWGLPTQCIVYICSDVVHHGLQDSVCHHGLLHGLQGIFSSTWSISSLPPSLTLVSAGLFFSLIFLAAAAQDFLAFLKHISTEA